MKRFHRFVGPAGVLAAFTAAGWAVAPPSTGEIVLETPPLDLPAHADHHAAPQPAPVQFRIEARTRVRGFEVELVDARGEPVPERILHHVKVLDPARRDLFHPFMLRLVGAGHETRGFRLPFPFAVTLEGGSTLLLTAMLHNPEHQAYEGVRVRVRLETVKREWPGRVELLPFFAHVIDASEPSGFDLPPGRSVRSWEGSPAVDGRVIGLSGHLHRYGTELVFEDVTRDRVLWRGRPEIDDGGEIIAMPRQLFRLRGGLPMRADRVYRVTAVYDNPTGEILREGGMGTGAGALIPARGVGWPAADPDHPIYRADFEEEMDPLSHHRGHSEHGGRGVHPPH